MSSDLTDTFLELIILIHSIGCSGFEYIIFGDISEFIVV